MSAPDPAAREALRRRLYRVGASPADLAAYRALGPEGEPDPPPPSGTAGRRTRSRALPAAVAVAVVGAATAAALVVPQPPPAPVGTPTAARAADGADVPARTAVTAVADRTGFVAALTAAETAGISAWLDRHAADAPGVLARVTRSDTVEASGSGRRLVGLAPPSVGGDGGRVTVLLVVAATSRAAWTLQRRGADPGFGLPVQRVSSMQIAGDLAYATLAYRPGRRPDRLLVDVPDGVRWGAAAVFSD